MVTGTTPKNTTVWDGYVAVEWTITHYRPPRKPKK